MKADFRISVKDNSRGNNQIAASRGNAGGNFMKRPLVLRTRGRARGEWLGEGGWPPFKLAAMSKAEILKELPKLKPEYAVPL